MAITFNELPEAISQINEKLLNLENLIRSHSNNPEKEDQLLTIEEAGKLLNLKKATIYGLVCRRAIPCLKPGKKLFFSKQAITKWIVDRNQKSIFDFDLGNKKRGK